MKMKNKFFDFKLYIEGVKRLKVIGTAFAVISFVMAFLVPLTYGYRASGIDAEDLIYPLVVLLLAAFMFVNRVFGYLTSRKKSDFYHAIPFPRKCVYFSFMASALTWVWGILIVSLLIESFMWGFNFYLSTVLLVGIAFAAATLFIMAVTAVARILTGTEVSSVALFAILFLFLRVCGTIAKSAMESLVPIYDFDHSLLHYLGFEFFLPFRVIMLYDTDGIIPLIIYTFIISIAIIFVGSVLYARRKSEMAGNSAPTPLLHNIYRYAISTPLLLLTTGLFLEYCFIVDRSYVSDGIIISLVLTLAVYFLYELITKKNIKKMFAAAKNLWVIFLIALVYAGGLTVTRNQILNYDMAAEDIESVEVIYKNGYYLYNSKNEHIKLLISDPELAKECAAQAYRDSCNELKSTGKVGSFKGAYTVIKLKSGREISCHLVNFDRANQIYMNGISERTEYSDEELTLPLRTESSYVAFYIPSDEDYNNAIFVQDDDTRWDTLWRTFREEYYALSDEEKAIVQTNVDTASYHIVFLEKHTDDKNGNTTYIVKDIYYIPDFMPKTCLAIYRCAK